MIIKESSSHSDDDHRRRIYIFGISSVVWWKSEFKAPFMPFIFMMAAFSISTFKLNKKA